MALVAMDCEVCGGRSAAFEAVVEGARLAVCEKCAEFGKIIRALNENTSFEKPASAKPFRRLLSEEDLVEDYAKQVKNARERLGLTKEALSKKIAVKEQELEKIERNELRPTIDVVEKLEQVLGVKLLA